MQRRFSDSEISAITHLLSFIVCLIWWGIDGFKFPTFNARLLWITILFGLTSPIAFYCFSFSLRKIPKMGIMCQYLEPVIGLFSAVIFLGEKLAIQQCFGAIMIFIGLFISQRQKSAKLKPNT